MHHARPPGGGSLLPVDGRSATMGPSPAIMRNAIQVLSYTNVSMSGKNTFACAGWAQINNFDLADMFSPDNLDDLGPSVQPSATA